MYICTYYILYTVYTISTISIKLWRENVPFFSISLTHISNPASPIPPISYPTISYPAISYPTIASIISTAPYQPSQLLNLDRRTSYAKDDAAEQNYISDHVI